MTEARTLPDVNVLIALVVGDHPHHHSARSWFDRQSATEATWGTWLLAQAGFIRIITNPRIGGHTLPAATGALSILTGSLGHRFWPITEDWRTLSAPFAERIYGHQQITDACLLGLAVRESSVLVTMDKAIAHLAGTKYRKNLLLLDPD